MFKKVLIANRGEIAVRIIRTLQQMGIRAVAVYSDVDRYAVHVGCADESYPLAGNAATETYLRGDRVIDIARRCGANAIHPGYGFLSENPQFAKACTDAGLVFIGPRPDVLRKVGDKVLAKKTLADAGVPVVPGLTTADDESDRKLAAQVRKIGFPVMVKAAAGGGGKGMRLVTSEPELSGALEAARREATSAFGDGRLFVEKFIQQPRHVEFQIFGDDHGNVVHLFERECSLQRRHQKIIEETPSPGLTPEVREKMGQAAVRAARAVGYTNAGTVEFLLDESGQFYFLEVNARLQVEHPVTEMIVGYDLVQAQILVAAGEPLPFSQVQVRPQGHAIECRVYAEDAASGFLPTTGTIERFVAPEGPDIRVDCGVAEGSEVSVYYDPMLAKLIAWGRTREQALARITWAIERFVVLGVTTNIEFLHRLLNRPEFRAGRIHTQFLSDEVVRELAHQPACDGANGHEALVAAAVLALEGEHRTSSRDGRSSSAAIAHSPWQLGGAWRGA